ncbi:MAG: metallophosphoesterase [Pseudomonadota bacterium]
MDHAGGHPASPFSFAFLSDPHLPLPDSPREGGRFKQRLGRGSWRRKRHLRHRPEVLAALLEDIRARRPDHIAIGGDLINIALPEEFERARDWLASVGGPGDVTLVPGNHDAYVPARGMESWQPWMTGDDGGPGFPFRRDRGPVSFIGLSSAVPKPPGLATGTLGASQIERAERLLSQARGRVRVVLVHHPVDGAASWRKALTDRADLQAVIGRVGADLILHGHLHHAHLGMVEGPSGGVPVIGVPSASMVHGSDRGDPAGWLHVEVAGDGLIVTTRGLGPDGFGRLSRFTFRPAAAWASGR